MVKIQDNLIVDGTVEVKQGTQPNEVATNAQVANKVDKVPGKGLSTNDFTNTYISKINAAESGYVGIIKTTDPTPIITGQYTPIDDGTYSNGLTYNKDTDGLTLFIFDGTTWTKTANLINVGSALALPWVAKVYQKSERVLDDNGDLYIAIEESEITENLTSENFMKNSLTDNNIYSTKGVYRI